MVLLEDFGNFILILAVVGFLVKDAFYLPRRLMLFEAYGFNKNSSDIFSNVALAVFLVSVVWYQIAMSISSNPEPVNNVLISLGEMLQKMVTIDVITQSEVEAIYSNIARGTLILTISSVFYLLSFVLISRLGFIYELLTRNAVNISFDYGKKEVYRRVLFESSDLIYLQKSDTFSEWVALKKDNITKVESIVDKSLMEVIINRAYSRFNRKTNLKEIPTPSKDG